MRSMTPDELISQAVEALKVATLLHEQYVQDVRGLATGTVVTLDQRLLAMDENYAGIWEKLDQAADLLEQAGRDMSQFRAIRATVPETVQGYHVKHEEHLAPTGVQQSSTWSVSRRRMTDLAAGLGALRQLVPGVVWRVEQDSEVEAYLASQRSPMRLLKPLIVLGLVAVAVGAILVVFQWMRPPDYGEHTRAINKLEKHLELDPCHKQRTVKLAESLNRAGAYEAALARCAVFFKACGEHRRLRWATLTAYKKMERWDEAIAEATILIKAVPRDRDYRYWRAELYEAKGDAAKAAVDYRQTLALAPMLADAPVDLTELSATLGRPCEGLLWLGNLARHHPADSTPVAPRLQRLRTRCTKLAGKGFAVVPLVSVTADPGPDAGPSPEGTPAPDRGAAPLKVTVNGAAVSSYELQQNALYVMLSSKLAARLGLKVEGAPKLIQRTPDGFFPSRLVTVKKIAAGAATAEQVQVLVTDKPPRGVVCVLGQSFLSRFGAGEPENGAVLLAPFSNPTQRDKPAVPPVEGSR